MRGLETVGEWICSAAVLEHLWIKLKCNLRSSTPHQLFACEQQHLRIIFFCVFAPALEPGHIYHICGNDRIVEGEHVVIVDEHILPSRLGLDVFDVLNKIQVVAQEFTVRIDLTCH